MNRTVAYNLFESMIKVTEQQLFEFTKDSSLIVDRKADKSVVTGCDKIIGDELTKIASQAGLQAVSEEGNPTLKIVHSGYYLTIDPIDGTLGYIDYVKAAIENEDLENVFATDLGAEKDFCLLLGLVENGQPKFGACYNYITKEKILIDSSDKNNFIRLNNKRSYSQVILLLILTKPPLLFTEFNQLVYGMFSRQQLPVKFLVEKFMMIWVAL